MKRAYSGAAVAILGVLFIITSLIWTYFLLIYGIPLFIIGVLILLNKSEDRIEKIKNK